MGWTHTGDADGGLSPVGGIPHTSRRKSLLPEQQQEHHVMY